MATGYIALPFGAWLPVAGAAATPNKIQASGSLSNAPTLEIYEWLMDAVTDEHVECRFVLPGNYSSGGTLTIVFAMASATTGDVVLKAGQRTMASGVDSDTSAFVAVDLSAATAVPGTAGEQKSLTIALTATGMAAGLETVIFVGRDADNASDTATGDLGLRSARFDYTTT